jgi:hypothetical protein
MSNTINTLIDITAEQDGNIFAPIIWGQLQQSAIDLGDALGYRLG